MSTPIERQLTPTGGWHATGAPRIPALTLAQLSRPMRALLWVASKWGKKRTGSDEVPAVFLLLMRHPRLFWPWLRFASRLMPYGTLDRRDAELVILRVGWNSRCRYEWGQHVGLGIRAGLTAAEIARVARGSEAPGWSPRQVALLEATDDLHQRNVISDGSWQRLAEHYRPAQLIEVSMLAGHYAMLAGLLTSAGLALDSEAERILETAPIHGDA